VKAGQKFKVFVDFAHTPNALEAVLTQLKKELPKNKKLIAVSGATGERDKEKRPMMGEIAARLADVVIITSDDTRSEDQDEIAAQIMSGIPETQLKDNKVFKENDRKKAIATAIKMAKAGDIILLAGKGHEKTILLGKTEYPWSDAEVARKLISDKS
jgi:UDP-N-acetylmuramoyl-L-alanyl-D-glutamate--2,6-diaminopimelate ligase